MVNVIINGVSVSAQDGDTILETAKKVGIHIPSLCHLKGINKEGVCRICVVKVVGCDSLKTACNTIVTDGMEIITEDEEILEYRRTTLDLLCREHRMECEFCSRYSDCRLHELLVECGMDDRKYTSSYCEPQEDVSSPIFVRDDAKCILCRRCEAVCAKQGIEAIGALGRGSGTHVGSIVPMPETDCIECGACVAACPTGALSIKSDVQKVWNLMRRDKKHMLAVVLPEAYEKLGKYMHFDEDTGKRLSAFLRAMGFERVYKMPAFEKHAGKGITISANCRPAVRFIRERYPAYANRINSCEVSSNASAYLCRAAYCQETGADKAQTAIVLITPCAAEKNVDNGCDAVLTPRELISFMNQGSVSKYTMLKVWRELEPAEFDCIATPNETVSSADKMLVYGLDALSALLDADTLLGKNIYLDMFACPGGCSEGGGQLM